MKQVISIFFLIFLCLSCEEEVPQKKSQNSYLEYTVIKNNNPKALNTELSDYDSLSLVKIDTSTLKGKRAYILNQLILQNPFISNGNDTLFDVNYDGFKDLIIPTYGQCGTGFKYGAEVYLYKKSIHSYVLDSLLSGKPNPSFFISEKKITSFYIANGAGYGEEFTWKNRIWHLNKTFYVDNKGKESVWEISYPSINKTEKLIKAYRMIPYENILQTNIKY